MNNNNNNNNNRLIVDTRIPISRLKTFIATASGQKKQNDLDRALLAVVMEEDADQLTPTRVRLLLEAGARPTYRPEIMIEAVFFRDTRVLDLLVAHGNSGSVKTIRMPGTGGTLLHAAVESRDIDDTKLPMLDRLFELGLTNVNARTDIGRSGAACGRTPLHSSTYLAITKWLLDHGAFVNAKDAFGETPLFASVKSAVKYALDEGVIENLAYLLRRGADPNIANRDGRTVISLIAESRGIRGADKHLLFDMLEHAKIPARGLRRLLADLENRGSERARPATAFVTSRIERDARRAQTGLMALRRAAKNLPHHLSNSIVENAFQSLS